MDIWHATELSLGIPLDIHEPGTGIEPKRTSLESNL